MILTINNIIFYQDLMKKIRNSIKTNSFDAFYKYEVKGSDQYYKFNSNLTEDKIVRKEIKNYKKTGLISYLLYEDGIILIDEKSPEHWLTSDKISEEKRLLV